MGGVRRDEAAGHDAVAQDGRPVGDGHHLVDVVRDEDHARPVRGDGANQTEQLLDAFARQEGRRLVQQHQPRLAGPLARETHLLERPHDGEERPVDGAETVDALVGIEPQVEARQRLARLLALLRPVDEAVGHRGQARQPQILQDGQAWHQPEILVDEAHPEPAEVARLQRQRHRLAVELHAAAGIGRMEPREDLHQGRFSGPVLAEQPVDLAGEHVERHPTQRLGAAEALGDAAQTQDRRRQKRRRGFHFEVGDRHLTVEAPELPEARDVGVAITGVELRR